MAIGIIYWEGYEYKSALAAHFDIGECGRVQVEPRLPLPPAVLEERLQRQAADTQPLAGAELSAEL